MITAGIIEKICSEAKDVAMCDGVAEVEATVTVGGAGFTVIIRNLKSKDDK